MFWGAGSGALILCFSYFYNIANNTIKLIHHVSSKITFRSDFPECHCMDYSWLKVYEVSFTFTNFVLEKTSLLLENTILGKNEFLLERTMMYEGK